MAVAISEPDAGSAATDMTTRAKLSANGTYTLNGTKRWISNGGEAEHYLVYCRDCPTSRGPRGSARSSSRRTGRESASAPRSG